MPRKQQVKRYNYNETLSALTGNVRYIKPAEEVAIEIEVEGENLPVGLMSYWDTHRDGSLRNGGIEYVLRGPKSRKEVIKALEYFQTSLKEGKAKPKQSNRTSIHVHMNCLTLTMRQIFQNICLYTIFEEPLVHFAGAQRVGNLFCLRASDAEYMIQSLRKAVRTDNYQAHMADGELLRYSSLNVAALFKYGSLEYRAMRGSTSPEEIQTWLDLIYAVKDSSLTYASPAQVLTDFSILGAEEFTKKTFGKIPPFFRKIDWEQKLHEGVRLIQDVAFASTWEPPAEGQGMVGGGKLKAQEAADPFGFPQPEEEDRDPRPWVGVPIPNPLRPPPLGGAGNILRQFREDQERMAAGPRGHVQEIQAPGPGDWNVVWDDIHAAAPVPALNLAPAPAARHPHLREIITQHEVFGKQVYEMHFPIPRPYYQRMWNEVDRADLMALARREMQDILPGPFVIHMMEQVTGKTYKVQYYYDR